MNFSKYLIKTSTCDLPCCAKPIEKHNIGCICNACIYHKDLMININDEIWADNCTVQSESKSITPESNSDSYVRQDMNTLSYANELVHKHAKNYTRDILYDNDCNNKFYNSMICTMVCARVFSKKE